MGREFIHPNGERLVFRQTAAETNGELLEMEATYSPHSPQPPLHFHPYQEEQFEVLSGGFRTRIGGTTHVFHAGDTFIVPAGTPHWLHNVSDGEGRLNWQIRPALKSQQFFETMWGLAAAGKTNADGVPNLLQLAVILRAHRDEFRACSPPDKVQRLLFALLAPIGKLLGYRSTYVDSSAAAGSS